MLGCAYVSNLKVCVYTTMSFQACSLSFVSGHLSAMYVHLGGVAGKTYHGYDV